VQLVGSYSSDALHKNACHHLSAKLPACHFVLNHCFNSSFHQLGEALVSLVADSSSGVYAAMYAIRLLAAGCCGSFQFRFLSENGFENAIC
jgi:hypothetical protein